MNRLLAIAILFASAAPGSGALAYSIFSHPRGDFRFSYPSNWRKTLGIQTLTVRPRGRLGKMSRVSLERHAAKPGQGAAAAKKHVARLLLRVGPLQRLLVRKSVRVSGRKAERIETVDKFQLRYARGTLPRLREIHVVVPGENAFYVLHFAADLATDRASYVRLEREFERMLKKVTFAPAP